MSKFWKNEIVLAIINFIGFGAVIAVIIFALKYSRQSATNIYVEDITDKWKNYYGKEIELQKICDKQKIKKDEKYYASYTLNRKVNRNYTLVFRASGCFVNVYVDGKLALTDDDDQNDIFGKSPGHRWHMVSIDSDKKECKISLEVKPAYRDGKGSIDNVYVGSPLGVVKQVLWDRMVGFIISVVLVLLGIMLCAIYGFVRNKQYKEDGIVVVSRVIPRIGCLTVLMGIYSSLETYFWQFCIGKSHFFQLLSYISVFLIAVIIGIIAKELIKDKREFLGNLIYWLGILLFFVATVLNFTGVLEYYYVMKIVYIYCALLSILIFIEGYNYIKSQDTISRLLMFGVCFFSVTFACDCIRFLSGVPDDICAYTRVGFLVFIVCIIIEVCEKAIKAMKQGALAEIYKKMADTDTLTALNNRNALLFDEGKYNELVRNSHKLAVVMFDVNDLKYVNDTFGHDKGDLLIKTAAKLINDSFGDIGKCYRTGGDEFISVLVCDNVEEQYELAMKNFLKSIKKYNKENKDNKYELEIAYGVSMSDEEDIGNMWHKADELMYKKKKEMKAVVKKA
ncbi:MAG: GGDEF domain-containing protein [Lachnospiraceae bacterium]|nr:GGDEF domain-containing protein [Lachnospiraceae bacterium]